MKAKIPLLFLLCFSLLYLTGMLISTPRAYSILSIIPLADAKVWKAYNTTNHGTSATTLLANRTAWNADGEHIGFFKHNVSRFKDGIIDELEANQEVAYGDIYFELYSDYSFGDHYFTLAYSTNQTWSETAITWLDYPSFTETSEDVLVDGADQYYTWNLNEIKQDVIDAIDNEQNFTIVIYYNGYEGLGFNCRMREYGGILTDPRITIEYQIVTTTPDEEEYVYEREPNLATFPYALGDALHIGDEGGKLLASLIVLCIFMLPTAYASRNMRQGQDIVMLVIGLPVMCLLVVIGYLQIWILLMFCVLVALMFAYRFRDLMGGK